MAEYGKFGKYLEEQNGKPLYIKFEEIEKILGEKLPDSAYKHREWWSNSESHPLMKIVLSKNWKSENVLIQSKFVEFHNTTESSLLQFLKYHMKIMKNYQPIVFKILLENKNHITNIPEIRKKFQELNFDRGTFVGSGERPLGNSAIDSVRTSMASDFISFPEGTSKGDVKLIQKNYLFKGNPFNELEIKKCLKICGEKIIKHHADNLMNPENQCYFIQAGKDGKYLKEFKANNFVAVDYLDKDNPNGDFDLTGMSKDEIINKNGTDKDATELFHISQIKPGDIIAVVTGSKIVEEFAIATSNYYFQDLVEKNKHRVNVEYLNFGTTKIGKGAVKGIIRDTSNKIKDFLTEDDSEYFLLRHNVDGTWKDDLGKKYHFGRTVPNHIPLRNAGVGTKTIWFTKENKEFYFWGHGSVKGLETIQENEEWNLTYDDFKYFEKYDDSIESRGKFLKRGNSSIKQQIENLPKYNKQTTMFRITKKIYQQIVGEDLTSEEDELDTMSMDNYDRALNWKPNLILYGPPGTGKTFHANKIAEKIAGSIPKFKEQTWLSVGAKILLNVNGNELGYDDFAEEATKIKDASVKTPEQTITRDIRTAITNSNSDSIFTNNSDGKYGLRLPTTFVEAARLILLAENRSMHSDEITEIAIKKQMINQRENPGITPNRSMNQILSQDVKNNNLDSNFIQTAPGTYALRNQILNERELLIYKVTFHPSYSYEDFVEGFRPNKDKESSSQYVLEKGIFWKACEKAKQYPNDKIALIIDEINRGNIPKILGELITLIEKDKRNKKNSLKLTYSKDDFFVPENLIIIGTMNTADKSLMQMDDALKRRFVFEELMPDTDVLLEHLKEKNITHAKNYSQILKRINEKILGKGNGNESERMKQFRDRQIGHSYFWDLANDDDLQTVMKYDIIPLLQDYFYGDYNEIRKILGKGFDGKDATIIGEDNRPTELVNDKSKNTQLKEKLLEI